MRQYSDKELLAIGMAVQSSGIAAYLENELAILGAEVLRAEEFTTVASTEEYRLRMAGVIGRAKAYRHLLDLSNQPVAEEN